MNELLSPVEYIQDDLIHAYLSCITKGKRVLVVPASTGGKIFAGSTSVFKKENLNSFDQIVIPLLVGGNHWTVVLISNLTEQLIYINPFGTNTSSAEAIFDSWLKFAKTRKEYNFIEWSYDLVEHSIQSDSFNCGVFICIFIEKFIDYVYNNTFDTSAANLLKIRKSMAQTLETNKD